MIEKKITYLSLSTTFYVQSLLPQLSYLKKSSDEFSRHHLIHPSTYRQVNYYTQFTDDATEV